MGWKRIDQSIIVNLDNASRQLKELGYLHRMQDHLQCSRCHKITMVDASIAYRYCPHCGAEMEGAE